MKLSAAMLITVYFVILLSYGKSDDANACLTHMCFV